MCNLYLYNVTAKSPPGALVAARMRGFSTILVVIAGSF